MELEGIGPYKVVGKRGRGGMGTVYEAVHRETGQAAAVKLLAAALADEEGFRLRFEGEIETLRKLNHANIVRLFGFGEQDGQMFYSMELVDGNSLEEELHRGRQFTWREVAQIGIEMCRALRHAHDRGIIHRDIKPGNVLLTADDHIKLSDFGIARLFGNTRLTVAGNVVGTAEYMSPEQAAGQPVDARSDLYSLGALLYTLLARRPVFRGKSLPEVLQKQRYEPPDPVRRHAADVPEEFEHILAELLEKEPAKRITNARLLGRRLEAMLRALSIDHETVEADADWFDDGVEASGLEISHDDPSHNERAIAATYDLPAGNVAATEVVARLQPKAPPPGQLAAGMPPPQAKSNGLEHRVGERSTFVPVRKEELDPVECEERPPIFSWHTGALVLALLALGAGAWWSLQPSSADSLYRRIEARLKDGSEDSLPRTASEIDPLQKAISDFLNRYPRDPRAAKLRGYESALRLRRMEWEFDRKIANRSAADGLLPIQQLYNEAKADARSDPALGAAKLQAMIDLYSDSEGEPGATEDCLTLAREKLKQFRRDAERFTREQLAVLRARLSAADGLRQTDPGEARKIYQAIVDLYGDKPWAADIVRRARRALSKQPKPEPATARH